MNRLLPSTTHSPDASGPHSAAFSPSQRAVVRVPQASEPAPGSVSPYAPMTLPLAIGTR